MCLQWSLTGPEAEGQAALYFVCLSALQLCVTLRMCVILRQLSFLEYAVFPYFLQ